MLQAGLGSDTEDIGIAMTLDLFARPYVTN